ncbi:fasciclin domain-containing protein [Rhodoferax aquaticus]|uniref:Fasciclin domain-containing protein n=1 Tax=Rhodoferax aquaticus TaxID=2527691 RepID=A0A515ENU5_9BURK|nr:fasciclin domain-containing protein [Rhodoferax aquaticus]QDL54342.1 fasciclin domain-containing protein [Rhodoferax aquaticus]
MTKDTLFAASARLILAAATALAFAGCATTSAPVNVGATIASAPSLSTLSKLVAKAGLGETLKSGGPFTVFAPSDEAFKAVPAKTLDELSQNPDKLKDLLTYHVVAAKLLAADIKNSDVKTLHGANVAIAKAGEFVTVENAAVTKADLVATNGVVHIIDTVMTAPVKK